MNYHHEFVWAIAAERRQRLEHHARRNRLVARFRRRGAPGGVVVAAPVLAPVLDLPSPETGRRAA